MLGSLERSWRLARESIGVLRKDPELMIFPVVSFIAGVLVAGILGGVGFAAGGFGGDGGISAVAIPFIFLFYFGTYFVTIYFQVALVASVKLRLAGGDPTLRYGVREANQRLRPILSWTFIAAIVGLVLRMLEGAARGRSGWGQILARIVIGLVGLAWSLATFFVIPIIAYQGVGGFEAIKRSSSVIKRNWGEAVVGQAGIMLVVWILAIAVGALFGIIGIVALVNGGSVGLVIGILFITIAVLGVLFIITMGSTLQMIYTAALYEYATEGKAGELFSRDTLEDAFRTR